MVCQMTAGSWFFSFNEKKKFCIAPNRARVGSKDCQIECLLLIPPSSCPSWSCISFGSLWAASFIRGHIYVGRIIPSLKPSTSLPVRVKTRVTSSFSGDHFLPSRSRASVFWRFKTKLCLSLSNHKKHLKNVWAGEKHPPLHALRTLKCSDGIWAENKLEKSQNKW